MGLPRLTIKGRCIACTARDRSIAAGIASIADDVDAFLLHLLWSSLRSRLAALACLALGIPLSTSTVATVIRIPSVSQCLL